MPGQRFKIEIQPVIPNAITGLQVLANDLYYSWNSQARRLYRRIDATLWEACKHSPKLFLRRVAQEKLDKAAQDANYREDYARVLSSYESYKKQPLITDLSQYLNPEHDLIAYFCLEFGFHESFPIYSGGLGILAADVCKAASDLAVPFVGIGLLYRQGYFIQAIDNYGNQIPEYKPTEFDQLPVNRCVDANNEEIRVYVEIFDRTLALKLWEVPAGNIKLYFLDSDIPENTEEDRKITYQLYGGNDETRILQEIVIGIGGVRALRALSLSPTVWHINEGHAAFSILERCRENVAEGRKFVNALELNATNTVFTTHTPVPAGHDIFTKSVIESHFKKYITQLHIDLDELFQLGNSTGDDGFNMTTLALHGSRFHNGVSKIHCDVASRMEANVWPQIEPKENPIGCVTNGVHLSTFLAREWANLFDMRFGDWRSELNNPDYWDCLDNIPHHRFWSLRQELKAFLLGSVHERLVTQGRRNGRSEATINKITRFIQPYDSDILVLGFARRFATYKRALLLFHDIERIARILNNPETPTVIIIAGKAHPNDGPGQEMIRALHEISLQTEFQGRVLFVENYDMALARQMVSGVDVWINTPEHPLEASGTSGQKAGINGVLNLSILDGWWAEGYNGKNGWGIIPHGSEFDADYRNQQEANDLLDILENLVIPLFFDRDHHGYSSKWVEAAKESMKSLIPRYNAQRMIMDYVHDYYYPAKQKFKAISENNGYYAREISTWKAKVKKAWPGVTIECTDEKPKSVIQGDPIRLQVKVNLNGLAADDVAVEYVISEENREGEFDHYSAFKFSADGLDHNHHLFTLDLNTTLSGIQFYKIRMYPYHELLCHPFELGCMVWV